MPSVVKIRVVPFILLLALVFAFLLNWPVLLHFYEIFTNMEHFKIGFAISIPILLVAALNWRCSIYVLVIRVTPPNNHE
jgi:lipid A ethanolaminephosphotransferase